MSLFAENHLVKLENARAKKPSREQEVILPHPIKSLVLLAAESRPALVEVFKPGHQGRIVITAEFMQIQKVEKALGS